MSIKSISSRQIQDPRFLALQIAVGVKDGAKDPTNQIMDAFHLWCAEHARADYFLTCDYKLLRHLASHRQLRPAVTVTTPRKLLAELRGARRISSFNIWEEQLRRIAAKISPPPPSGLEDLAILGERLEREGYYDSLSDPSV